MAYDFVRKTTNGTDWSLGLELSEDPAFVYTASDLNRIVGTAITEEQQLVNEASAARAEKKLGDGLWNSVTLLHNEFHTWLKGVGKPPYSMFKLNMTNHYQGAKRYRERIADMRKMVLAQGGPVFAPDARGIPKPGEEIPAGGIWKWVALAGAGALGYAVISKKLGI